MPRIEFRGIVRAGHGGGALVNLPPDAATVFGTRARFPIRATFNGVAYRGSTMPMGDGTFCVGLTKAVRDLAGIRIGDSVDVVVQRDDEERTVVVPPDLASALADAGLTASFEKMAFTHRKEYAAWITGAKTDKTRAARVEKAVAMIAGGIRPS